MDERALANLLHEALDAEDVSGPYQRLRLELEKPSAASRRRGRRIFMTRNRLVLLAAALVLVLGASILISTRVFTFNRVGQSIPAGPDPTAVAQLLARPLHLQHVATETNCPDGPYAAADKTYYGTGPVYGFGGTSVSTAWGTYWSVGLLVDKGTKGPIVFRGEDIVLGWPLVFLGPYQNGPLYGHDTLNGKTVNQYTALALDTTHPPRNWVWQFQQGFKHYWSGCVGFQVDGPDFSEVFYSAGSTA